MAKPLPMRYSPTNGIAFQKLVGLPHTESLDLYREKYPNAVWRFNPWTGIKRTETATRNDRHGMELQQKPELHVMPETVDGLLKTIEGTFAWALLMMERGQRVRMREWRAKGTWVMIARANIAATDHPFTAVRDMAIKLGLDNTKQTTYVYFTKDRNFHYGWLATHCSMTAKTWEIVPDAQ